MSKSNSHFSVMGCGYFAPLGLRRRAAGIDDVASVCGSASARKRRNPWQPKATPWVYSSVSKASPVGAAQRNPARKLERPFSGDQPPPRCLAGTRAYPPDDLRGPYADINFLNDRACNKLGLLACWGEPAWGLAFEHEHFDPEQIDLIETQQPRVLPSQHESALRHSAPNSSSLR